MAHIYTKEQDKFIRERIKGTGTKELTEMFNEHFKLQLGQNQIRAYIKNHKLKSGIDARFRKGRTPCNKGKKGICAEGCEKTWFKKGHTPANHKPVGSERVDVDGYTLVKVAEPRKWRLKHQLVWEEHNGPVPKGYAVIFGDSDKRNFDISNLILVSKKQLLILNNKKLIQNDAELTRTAVIVADLYQKINDRKKPRKNKGE